MYKQYRSFDTVYNHWVGYNLNNEYPPSLGNSVSDINFLSYPLDGRNLPSPYTIPQHLNAGVLNGNLTIDDTVSTPDTLLENPTNILITKNVLLKINAGKIFNLTTPLYPQGSYTHLNIDSNAKLQISPNAIVNVFAPNKITLDTGSFLLLNPDSQLNIFPGAYFCNNGGTIYGRGNVYFRSGLHQNLCLQISDFLFKHSVKLILDSNAVLPIPNNTTLHFKGNSTSLIMNPGSKLLFGENSGIVCDNGGKLIANNATFASSDSTKKWNGISLSGLSQDTIKNCTIKNAMYGIALNGKYSENDDSYSTEISGCTFINQTSYVLNNGVYIAGSNNVLVMNNSVSSTILEKGFTHGIYAEYCPEGNFDLINNTIYNSGNGMTLIACSPFVAQNTLTGNEYSECI